MGVQSLKHWVLVLLAGLMTAAQARAAEEDAPVQQWWEAVVEITARRQGGGVEHGFGLVVGRLEGAHCNPEQRPSSALGAATGNGLACIENALLVVTANHLVRSPEGRRAERMEVRSQWDVSGPKEALPLELFDAKADIAVIAVPVGEEPPAASVAVGCTDMLTPAAPMMLGQPSAVSNPVWGTWAGRDADGKLLFHGLGAIRGVSGAPVVDSVNTVVGIITASEGENGVAKGIAFERIKDTLMKDVGSTTVQLSWNVIPTCGCASRWLATKRGGALRPEDVSCTEPALWMAVQKELRAPREEPTWQLAHRFAARREDFNAVFVEKTPGSLWRYYQERLASVAPAKGELMSLEALALQSLMPVAPSLPRCRLIPLRFAKANHHLIQELFYGRVEILGLRRDLSFCEFELVVAADERVPLLFLALNGKWVLLPED